MKIVKLNATTSTNTYLRAYTRKLDIEDDTIVWATEQSAGKGQRGAYWESEKDKNLTFSVFKRVEGLPVDRQFYITMATSLAIYEALQQLGINQLSVKWPNDILAGRSKICGVLIESVIRNGLYAVIIGIGINVNQKIFTRAPRATSILLETGKYHEPEEIMKMLISKFYHYVDLITNGDLTLLKAEYESKLFRKDKASTFELPNGELFTGIIKEVSKTGKLILQVEDELLKEFDLKELKLLY
ncbi:biotin--[acetyl-CoA-carboxylase] ligase [Leeuwenhoekiella sp. MAR_2009_132]|uniref:biotin--[acetyl-CoA-carboxylase] ligase n=1 Tax=Leeuwenhoekiella sp. MAR_2009_132 TaxID=1392489 RepID=UPI00048F0A7F|nr:biotin--[acetyl-CoA-carboxylase] ligase [Leeuwenhoekiella sp. MAR_2009_132]